MGLVKPKKFLGQHFLKDLSIAKDIADPADVRNEVVLPAMYDKDLKKTYGDNPIFINKFPLGALGDMRLAF